MRKTLVAVAFAGAALAPAAALTTAAALAPSAAVAAPKAKQFQAQQIQAQQIHAQQIRAQQLKAKRFKANRLNRRQLQRRIPDLRRAPLLRRPGFQIARRCFWPRVSIRHEIRRLRHSGYRQVRYAGRRFFRPRCAMFLHFNACRGAKRYLVMVRFINHRRFVIAQNRGFCFRPGRVLRRP